MHGGDAIADVLVSRGVKWIFTLCGGHISPILVGCKKRGIRVVDTREEVNAVFAADAAARLTGNVGVAAVTAGPGVTNTITALKNAQMAESPVLVFGGATATVLRGRGSLQDIDQISILQSITKWAQRLGTRAHHAELALDALFDEAGALQHLQVARDRGSGNAERLGDRAHREIAAGEQPFDDCAPGRVGERGEHVVEVRGGRHGLAFSVN